ncbi:MAG: hypothetical protein EPO27_10510 [Betaproteobacteria bacterium]|nr:MAG: hypothetical protein EPO27_10510 [Betaproteobacteria bacterium]
MTLKPGDLVRTPTGRTAVVDDIRKDGKRDLHYIDGGRDQVALDPELLTLITSCAPQRWTKRTL